MSGLRFSPKQRQELRWWRDGRYDAVICDGAVRSGKTFAMGLSFFLWAMTSFRGRQFGLCAPTQNGVRRNVLAGVRPVLERMGFRWEEQVSRNQLTVRYRGRENVFYIYGGRNEASASLIQGITLTGVLLDETALMPRSFVEQACARCSAEGARLWFSCNPEGPEHWFYQEWILRAEEKGALYLRFTMEDNPALSGKVRRRYRKMFQGTFYRRYVLGEWVAAEGWCTASSTRLGCPTGRRGPSGGGAFPATTASGTRRPSGCGARRTAFGTGWTSITTTPGRRGGR